MEKKEGDKNVFGLLGWSFGIIGIIISFSSVGIGGIISGIIGLILCSKQNKIEKNEWSKAGKVLNIVAIILGAIILIGVMYVITKNIQQLMTLNGQGLS